MTLIINLIREYFHDGNWGRVCLLGVIMSATSHLGGKNVSFTGKVSRSPKLEGAVEAPGPLKHVHSILKAVSIPFHTLS